MIEQLLLNPFVQTILAALFIGAFILSAARNTGSDGDDDNQRKKRRQKADSDDS